MPTPAEAIRTYIRAKDDNRAYLMPSAFTPDSSIEVVLRTSEISFPEKSVGLETLTAAMIRRFNVTYENIHTFCLGDPPAPGVREHHCGWLVGMSEKASLAVRVGCGQYDWRFTAEGMVEKLTITIAVMKILDPGQLQPVMAWISALPYPWCPLDRAVEGMPAGDGLREVAAGLGTVARHD